jgi:hypothetical protein
MPLQLAESEWTSLLPDPELLVVLAVWIVVGAVVIGIVLAIQWRRVQIARLDAELKERMIEQGFTAEDIMGVMNSGADRRGARTPGKESRRKLREPDCCSPMTS